MCVCGCDGLGDFWESEYGRGRLFIYEFLESKFPVWRWQSRFRAGVHLCKVGRGDVATSCCPRLGSHLNAHLCGDQPPLTFTAVVSVATRQGGLENYHEVAVSSFPIVASR